MEAKLNPLTIVVVLVVFGALAGAVYAKIPPAEIGALGALAVGIVSQLKKAVEPLPKAEPVKPTSEEKPS